MSNYFDNEKVGHVICREKFEIDIENTDYIFDIDTTMMLLEKQPTLIGVFAKPQSRLQQGILVVTDKCGSVGELNNILNFSNEKYEYCKDSQDVFVSYTSVKITFAFCKFGYAFLLAFPRQLIDYKDKRHVDYVSQIEDENQELAIHIAQTMSLALKVDINSKDRRILQDFCEKYVSSYMDKNPLDDYCLANTLGTISRMILFNLRQEISLINDIITIMNAQPIKDEELQSIQQLLDKYLGLHKYSI